MHEAESMLGGISALQYIRELKGVVWNNTDVASCDSFKFIRATAAQRAEAFLRTIGKWLANE
jgi:hypothetical protein